jgi:hypothetical protein
MEINTRQKLSELFKEWVEADHAQYYVACLLGLMEYDDYFANFRRNSALFHVRNKFGTMFHEILTKLVEAGVLQSNEYAQYRWNNSSENVFASEEG